MRVSEWGGCGDCGCGYGCGCGYVCGYGCVCVCGRVMNALLFPVEGETAIDLRLNMSVHVGSFIQIRVEG